MVPSTTRHTAARLSRELPVIPPFESPSYQQHYQQQSQSMQPTSPLSPSSPLHTQYQYPLPGAQIVPKAVISDIPSRSSSLDSVANDRYPVTNAYSNINGQYGNGVGAQRPLYGGLSRSPSQVKPGPMQHQQQQQQQQSGAGRTRKASVISMVDDNHASPSGLSRQISAKRSSVDGYREIDVGNYGPLPQESRKSAAKNELYREESPLLSRTPSRRATVGDGVPKASFAGPSAFQVSSTAGLPVVPPKNKNRPTSIDAKGRNSNLLPKIQYTTVKLDQQGPFRQPQPVKVPNFSSIPMTTPTSDKEAEVEVDGASVSRSNSANTFGHGRRSSLSNVDNIMTNSSNGVDTVGSNTPSTVSSSATLLGVPSAGHGRNSLSTDGSGTSTCSSATSSGFTSNSSVSPLSTQTRKHSMLSTSATNASLLNINNNNSQGAVISTSSKLSRSNTAALPSPPPVKTPEKEVHQFRDVDFDTQIQDNVRKLASSSSKSRLRDEMDNNGMIAKLEIQATDPRVLDAPIVVPEDMSLMRDQYIRDQLSGIVLPPLERKARANVGIEIDADAVARRTKAVPTRRISISSGIPGSVPSAPSPSMILQNQGSKRLFMEQPTLDLSGLVKPQLGGARPRSSTPSSATALSPLPTNGLNGGKARISDRIRMFERA
ncbi:hypothetical protein EDD21DRAFT_377887 [Dissophora ornata]|nr:hypothetical protein EDD21DRAFT_377887 [Dissophora ornata]